MPRGAAVRLLLPGVAPAAGGGVAGWNAPPISSGTLGPGEKLLHFVRHAEGTHNLHRSSIKLPVCHDARLTAEGVAQCGRLQRAAAMLRPQLVVASPLTRTLQTAELSFGPQRATAGAPLVALEAVRETVNYLCDGRRTLSAIAAEHPNVDFSACPDDHDEVWARYERRHGDQAAFEQYRETADMPALVARAAGALEWLGARAETEIVVVGHSAFWHHFFRFGHGGGEVGASARAVDYGDDAQGQAVAAWMMTPFANCEMRTVVARWATDDHARAAV